MKEWIYSILAIILLTTIISIIVPDGKLGKMIKGIFALIVMLVIISPIMSFSSFNTDSLINNTQIDGSIQDSFLNFINENKTQNLENEILESFNKIGVKNALIDLDYEYSSEYVYSIKNAKIYLNNAVINSEKEHILVIEEMINTVIEKTNLLRKDIYIYE